MSDVSLKRIEKSLALLGETQTEICERIARLETRIASLPGGGCATREEVIGFLDQFRAGEALGEASIGAWAAVCQDPCLRGGLRTIAQREGFHSRLLEERLKELGGSPSHQIPEDVYEKSMRDLGTAERTDAEKLQGFLAQFPDPDALLKPIEALADRMLDDAETQSLVRTILQDERSTRTWLCQACEQLSAA